jgi:hypothetical protein
MMTADEIANDSLHISNIKILGKVKKFNKRDHELSRPLFNAMMDDGKTWLQLEVALGGQTHWLLFELDGMKEKELVDLRRGYDRKGTNPAVRLSDYGDVKGISANRYDVECEQIAKAWLVDSHGKKGKVRQ